MSLSGRQQTLSSIYGAPLNDGKKKVLKPQRPKSRIVLRKNGQRRPAPFAHRDNQGSPSETVENSTQTDLEHLSSVTQIPPSSPSEGRGSPVDDEKVAPTFVAREPAPLRENLRKPVATKGANGESTVISLYGDGFLEIPLSDTSKSPESTQSSRLLGNCGFSISMLLFKAADTGKSKVKIEAGGARHKTPELDDTGDFVRWLCCGSTNRSIFGCSSSTDEETSKRSEFSNVFQESNESTPKLLSTKLCADKLEDDETTFSLYDRGVLPTFRERGEDGGCRVRWRGWECWANNYEVPSNRWVNLKVVFDCRYLQILFDDELVDCARIQRVETSSISNGGPPRTRRLNSSSAWVQASSNSHSVYVGGHPSYARSVRDWRAKIGFVGMISTFKLWKLHQSGRKPGSRLSEPLISLTIPEVGSVQDNSHFGNTVNAHRTVFWRVNAPPIWTPVSQSTSVSVITKRSIVLLANFFDGAHHDVGVANPKSFENLLLTAVQSGDIRVLIEYAAEFSIQRSHDHVCRSQIEYEQKTNALVTGIEQMSHLLTVVVNSGETRPPTGFFEITMELTRAAGRRSVEVVLHSMNSTGCFPNLEDIKKKIESIVLFEAKRSPGDEIQIQAFRHLLALAGQTRHNRERTLMESVINRKLVLTERKVAAEFEKIGFYFAAAELQEVVSYLKRIQDDYYRAQNHRMDDLPSLSMLTPTPTGLYTLPFMNTLLVSSTMMCDNGGLRVPWRFICILVDYDFQLVDFVHDGCPVTKRGGITYRQGQSNYNSTVDRLFLRVTALSNKVSCVLFSLQKISEDEGNSPNDSKFSKQMAAVRVQIENAEEHQVLGMFDAKPTACCRWFTLAAVYRSKKNNQWQLQPIGGCGNATSIYASIDEVNVLLAELKIIQTYEIRVHFIETGNEKGNTMENCECETFARQLAKNIRFGKNGRIVLIPMNENEAKFRLRIALKLQEVENEIDVYTHRNATNRTLPTIQSVYRTLLRILAQHGIKECLQQNPFAPQNKRIKRHVEFRVVSAQTNAPVEKVHVFIEKNLAFDGLSSNLAKTVLPTLMMGSRLMSIRRRLQKKRVTEITQEVAESFVTDCIEKASKRVITAANLNVTFISVVRARALLRRVMRLRYEKIKGTILERARASEYAQEYSQGVPIRLQRLFTNRLELSESERDLLQNSTRGELAELDLIRRGVAVPSKEKPVLDERALLEEWSSKKAQFVSEEDQTEDSKKVETQKLLEDEDSKPPDDTIKDRRQLFVTDSEGRANCRLIPGSYSLYVFHLDYFEWTSLVAVYPTISASGLYSGPTTASSSVQEMVIPLDVFRWTYSLQLVDYFNPHVTVKLAGIPFQITDNCSSERQVVMTDSNGCATWDVCKGLYAVDVLRECSCVLYSALKQVVVDGGRYRTSRTISMPVLFGGVKVTVLVVTTESNRTNSELANVRFLLDNPIGSVESANTGKRRNANTPFSTGLLEKEERSDGDVSVGSSKAFKLPLGTYNLEVKLDNYFPVSLPVNVTWSSSKTQAKDGNRYLAVLSPTITIERTYRVVLSYLDEVESMDAILEVWKDKTKIGDVWRQNSDNTGHAKLEIVNSIEGCEFQSLLLQCQPDFTYKCIVASNLPMTHCLRPQVQIYSSAGLIYQCSGPPSIGGLYWHVCSWNACGELDELSPSS